MNSGTATAPTHGATLAKLTAGLIAAPAALEVSDVTLDSRTAGPGALFLACRGHGRHGAEFVGEALARGASAVLYEPVPGALELIEAGLRGPAGGAFRDVFVASIPQLSRYAGVIADRFFGEPSAAVTVAGITGTNGKTTCAWLLAQALGQCERPAAYMGTIGFGFPGVLAATEHTTEDAVTVHRRLAALRALGAEVVSMEVSSHALDQHRVGGVRFHTAAFTNLTRDHLDYHGSMTAYADAKARLFGWPGLAVRVINVDDAFGAQLAAQLSAAQLVITTRASVRHEPIAGARVVSARRVEAAISGLIIEIESSWGTAQLNVPLIGEFNADNVLTVLAVLLAWDIPLAQAAAALESCRAAPGRMETFGGGDATPLAIVDYSHTPDALAKALRAARRHCRARLRVIFGCGGDRDPGKRPMMGRIAAELADELVVTDDNPRNEPPERIVADILAGIPSGTAVAVEHDRALAIRRTLERSGPADVVLIAGKGHEAYQTYGSERRPFSDQSVARAVLEAMQP
ncbi:MAG TPA: UDP-N-acetylmuramoyl-L-alanyl-D-glutamate--2,6-diaminopimelate ligase [Steroidobacteraceae bacterium]|jgi:UDP-N-acetylmuramoyl-L-alanyl-D-glutamate--2,6-diaminopimelate ligase|nr:UDP-N-acetylmuramoyl-L-alanyl-D-glutamate--2,6-diaminopimelate ligase [Steroidobacteraceae bacterium]